MTGLSFSHEIFAYPVSSENRFSLEAWGSRELKISQLAEEALWMEVTLTPKPGLVDCVNSGSHSDMNISLFIASIKAITPWLEVFVQAGEQNCHLAPHKLFDHIRMIGRQCEEAMFKATNGVNTHKGGIFALGLLCSAAGLLQGNGVIVTRERLSSKVAAMCTGLVKRELFDLNRMPITVGEKLFSRYGLTGARGEASSGFATVQNYALPMWFQNRGAGYSVEHSLLASLLVLMAVNLDTNLVSRGGISGLRYAQSYARKLLHQGWSRKTLCDMDKAFIARGLSPGGSADLLMVTWILGHLPP